VGAAPEYSSWSGLPYRGELALCFLSSTHCLAVKQVGVVSKAYSVCDCIMLLSSITSCELLGTSAPVA